MKKNSARITLVPEPNNKFDKNAVRVEFGGRHVGYIPKDKKLPKHTRPRVFKAGMKPQPHVWLTIFVDKDEGA